MKQEKNNEKVLLLKSAKNRLKFIDFDFPIEANKFPWDLHHVVVFITVAAIESPPKYKDCC